MSKPLFTDFESVSSKAWKQKIQFDLKGADYNDTLIWKTNDGINVTPFYHADQFETLPPISDAEASHFKISQSIEVKEAKISNSEAIDAINRGAESIQFIITSTTISIEDLLKDIDISLIPIHFEMAFLNVEFVTRINSYAKSSAAQLNLSFNSDIIGNLAKTGNWFKSLKDDHNTFDAVVKNTNQLYIDLSIYQNAGATNVQQLGYALAHINEYLNHLEAKLTSKEKETLRVVFNVSVGTNYFFEIAKLRALRLLWATLASAYHCNPKCIIRATPSRRNKTIYDYNINMLRTTTECMSAVLGGANTITNLAYDNLYHEPNEFGNRISRNQLLILKKESYFDAVNNPSDGAYYIESLTQQLAEKALELLKNIEANKGFLHQLKAGVIQRKIKESADKEQSAFNTGALTLLGTNKHPNPDDKMKNDLEKSPFIKIVKRKVLVKPIIQKRLSEELEINRLKEE